MKAVSHHKIINRDRRAGVLLHPTSLPGPYSNGDIGHEAYRFIEFLDKNGFKVWQMLPLGPTHDDKSPYQCLSAHAGNSLLISLDWLVDRGWLELKATNGTKDSEQFRLACLKQAGEKFYNQVDDRWLELFGEFKLEHKAWLDDFTLYIALKNKFNNLPWYEWPDEYRRRDVKALTQIKVELSETIKQIEFEQFVFFTQWHEIRDYAKKHNVELFGDVPIFVARDSADVWANRKNFIIDEAGNMPVIAGVPPDAFSDTGQRWGNPLYDWSFMQQDNFNWWIERFKTQLELFDMVRLDHFRGLQACWEIPEQEETAMNGRWVEVPGQALLDCIYKTFDELPLIAEDLGVITDEVIALKESFELPGMKVLQFAFDGNPANPHLPHQHSRHDVIYTGTHDNDTTPGWLAKTDNYNKEYFMNYAGIDEQSAEKNMMVMLRLALSSVSFLCMIPLQDILMLGSEARMNMPGTIGNNWIWRFDWNDVNQDKLFEIRSLMTLYQR